MKAPAARHVDGQRLYRSIPGPTGRHIQRNGVWICGAEPPGKAGKIGYFTTSPYIGAMLKLKTALFAFLLPLLVAGCQSDPPSKELRRLDPTAAILNDPARLLAVTVEVGNGSALSHDIRLEAFWNLLALQRKRFAVRIPPVPAQDTTGLDHPYVGTLQLTENEFVLLATPRLKADHWSPEGTYWSMETLTFTHGGKLLKREPYKDPAR